MRLKSRTKWPPHGFQILLPQTGMKEPITGSFSDVVNAFARIVDKNPSLAEKHGWPTNRTDQEDWIDERESHRMVAHGWLNFVDLEGAPASVPKARSHSGSVGGAVAKAKTALAIYRDLFGPDGKVVAKEEAERRAAICVECPKNDTAGGLKKYFIEKAAAEIGAVLGMLKDMDVSTSLDDKLGTCEACSCPMRMKVHVSNEILKKNLKPDQISKLHSMCWIPAAIA